MIYSFLYTSLLFQTILVVERESNLRYILNFIGMRSSSYYVGTFLAELGIFALISISLILFSLILGLDAINNASVLIFFHMMAFGFAYIPFNYVISFMF